MQFHPMRVGLRGGHQVQLINKGKGELYVIQRPNGLIIRLRAFSSSAGKTGAKWTVDVVHPSINNGGAVEMKFK